MMSWWCWKSQEKLLSKHWRTVFQCTPTFQVGTAVFQALSLLGIALKSLTIESLLKLLRSMEHLLIWKKFTEWQFTASHPKEEMALYASKIVREMKHSNLKKTLLSSMIYWLVTRNSLKVTTKNIRVVFHIEKSRETRKFWFCKFPSLRMWKW